MWWLEAFFFIKSSNNHLNGSHTFCSIGDTPTNVEGLPGQGKKISSRLWLSRYLCFAPFFKHITKRKKWSLQISFCSVADHNDEELSFCRWWQSLPFFPFFLPLFVCFVFRPHSAVLRTCSWLFTQRSGLAVVITDSRNWTWIRWEQGKHSHTYTLSLLVFNWEGTKCMVVILSSATASKLLGHSVVAGMKPRHIEWPFCCRVFAHSPQPKIQWRKFWFKFISLFK